MTRVSILIKYCNRTLDDKQRKYGGDILKGAVIYYRIWGFFLMTLFEHVFYGVKLVSCVDLCWCDSIFNTWSSGSFCWMSTLDLKKQSAWCFEVEVLEECLYLQTIIVFECDSVFKSLGSIMIILIFSSSELESFSRQRLRASTLRNLEFERLGLPILQNLRAFIFKVR